MFFITILNYNTNLNKKIICSNFYLIKNNFIFNKIKKKYFLHYLNIKQIIFLLITFKKWKFIILKNNLILISFINYEIKSNLDGIFKLYLISKKCISNNILNLNKIFDNLKLLIWTNIGCFDINDFYKLNLNNLKIIIESIDKIPYLTKYLTPKNIRISNSNRIRLGSYISEGVTIMSEGYVNFNTYIGKNCMIEGRISSGVYISDYNDIGGSSSIMGTLSGGGKQIISLGKNCLLGANSGIGISLGNNCIIEAGLYITSGTKINLLLKKKKIIIKAKFLSFLNNLIFYRNSINGKIECCKNISNYIKINKCLHNN
ncbi:tetrahydrodipicolinate N-succinyltransferase [Candidatus Carsonella ruddii HT isolate Thao2000]|uniref:Tetrahydrodipicolinate N-succinyltransferase n=1 Tax=Candidatus Carsonella ruddii HT isolate Thao2000 TaxID=1202539 RepID=J3Z1D7_CARRU|nr:DapH/DapD/GlmU-related protein [Candidatus Carsonella ruddii]AFP84064.1 tetrahydrodipicolinate N-succinyltransferase [Candidatus Carsonella ruddii HT isolate Thao2000]